MSAAEGSSGQAHVTAVEDGVFRDHGPVCRNFRFYWPTAQLCADRNLGREVLLVVDNAGRLMVIDLETGETTPYPLPVSGSAWHARRARDGTLWIGLGFASSELVRFDVTQRDYLPVAARPSDGAKIICDVTEGEDGCIYYASATSAQLWRYDPETGEHELLVERIDPENAYPYCLTTGYGGRIFIAMACDLDRLWCYDPGDGSLVNMTPEQYQAPGLWNRPVACGKWVLLSWFDHEKEEVQVHLYDGEHRKFVQALNLPEYTDYSGDTSNLVEMPDGRVFVKVARGRFQEVSLPSMALSGGFQLEAAHDQMTVLATSDGGRLAAGWGQEYGVAAADGGRIGWRRPATEPLPHRIFSLYGGEDGLVYGSAEVGNTIFWYDPRSGESVNTGQVTDTSGEVYGICSFGGKLYTASYTWAVITVFDPARPWSPGEEADSNPRTIGRIGHGQYRPVGGIHPGPRGLLAVGTVPNYGMSGGAFTLIDPETEQMRVYRNRVPGGTVNEFATDGDVLFGYGGGEFLVFDPDVEEIVFRKRMPGGPMAFAGDKLYMADGDGLVRFDAGTRAFDTVPGVGLQGVPRHSLRAGRDGSLWAISGATLVRIDPAAGRVFELGTTRGRAKACLTQTPDGVWWFTVAGGLGSFLTLQHRGLP